MSRRKSQGISAAGWFYSQSFKGGSRERSMNGSCLPAAIGQAKEASEVRLETARNSTSLERPLVVDPGSNPGVSTNPYEANARRVKAERLAAQLHGAGVLASEVPGIAREHWIRLAKALVIHPPSPETVLVVAEIMAGLEAALVRVDQMTEADVFARFA